MTRSAQAAVAAPQSTGAPARAQLGPARWHFQHGPIDLVIGARGDETAVRCAIEAAWDRFRAVLAELVGEIALLRMPVDRARACPLRGPIARRMWFATAPFAGDFITPMAAVAGSVAQELAPAFERPGLARAWLNNGGDIALVLAPGERVEAAIGDARPERHVAALRGAGFDRVAVAAESGLRGIATSGWRGRSLSLGIADAVTVVAASASQADAAATMIANATDVDDARIVRRPALTVREDSDLGMLPVTVAVPRLGPAVCARALANGLAYARACIDRGLAGAVRIELQGQVRTIGAPSTGIAFDEPTSQPRRDREAVPQPGGSP